MYINNEYELTREEIEEKITDKTKIVGITHVSNVLGTINNVKEKAVGQEVNICSNSEISMRDTLELIAKLMDADVNFIEDKVRLRPAKSEVFRLWGDNSKIKELTGYEPHYSLETGLKETISWFLNKDNLNMYKSDIYNV